MSETSTRRATAAGDHATAVFVDHREPAAGPGGEELAPGSPAGAGGPGR